MAVDLTVFAAIASLSFSAGSAVDQQTVAQPTGSAADAAVRASSLSPQVQARRNPYNRDIDLTTPVIFNGEQLSEIPVTLTKDDQVVVDAKAFSDALIGLLNAAGKQKLSQVIHDRAQFSLDELVGSGIDVIYDPNGLSLDVRSVDPNIRSLQQLFKTPGRDNDKIDIQPEFASAFLNVSTVLSHLWNGPLAGTTKPSFYFDGATRIGDFVLEGDGQYATRDLFIAGSPYRFDRQYLRLVYDQPGDYRRWLAGDLTPDIRGLQGYVQLGGLGVSRQRLRFDQFQPAVLQGNRQIILQRPSTVDVYRNGALYQQFRLSPGAYDLSTLPLITGSNDIQIQVRDDSGRAQTLSFQSYLDPIDLAPGDYEFAAYLGKAADRVGLSPHYGGPLSFTGFFRKAIVNGPSYGIGLQGSQRIQQLTGQTQFVILDGSRLQLLGGVSHATVGIGYSVTAALDKIMRRGDLTDTISVQVNYTSRRFGGVGYDTPNNGTEASISAVYARGITRDFTAFVGGNYLRTRDGLGSSYRLYVNGSYRISRHFSVQAGADYSHFPSNLIHRSGPGFSVALIWQPGVADRAEFRHDSSLSSTQLSYLHSSADEIGSVGYGAIADREQGSANAQGFANYIGNRFDGFLSHTSFGTDFQHITQQQLTTARITTAFAWADGGFGLGRRINDSFAVLDPHPTLRGHEVVAGQSISENEYMSRSGTFGGAVNGYLASYVPQSIQYDVASPPPGYDVGPGVLRVRPTYHSGYHVVVGTDAFVSAIGTVVLADGKVASLISGKTMSLDKPTDITTPFFTNSVGRFAIQNLRPGARYRVDLTGDAGSFVFTVPKDNKGLFDLTTIRIAKSAE